MKDRENLLKISVHKGEVDVLNMPFQIKEAFS